jgi:hypothetical protein
VRTAPEGSSSGCCRNLLYRPRILLFLHK